MSLTLKNCILKNKTTDIFLKDEKITKIGSHKESKEIIDCEGLVLLPGLIDSHVHFREPGFEYKEDWTTGSRAAIKGGVTTVLDMPNTNPPTIDKVSLEQKKKLAQKSLVNFGFHFGATNQNIQLAKKIKGIAGVKIYVGSSTGNLLVDNPDDIKKLFTNNNQLFLVHAEDEKFIQEQAVKYKEETDPRIHTKIRAPEAAAKAVEMLLELIEQTRARVHFCHITTAKEVALIAEAKKRGLAVTCEVTPHHLFLTEEEYDKQDNWVKMNPPLRLEKDRQALWQGIKEGIIDTIGTDHAPHTQEEKKQDYWKAPAGIPGVETMLPLLLNEVNKGNLTLEELVKLTSSNPAKIFRLSNKGKIEEGLEADLILVDLNLQKEIKNEKLETKCGWSPFENRKLKGWPIKVIINGHLVLENNLINDNYKGKYLYE